MSHLFYSIYCLYEYWKMVQSITWTLLFKMEQNITQKIIFNKIKNQIIVEKTGNIFLIKS